MRLNGWQRIGVVLLVLWVLGGLSGTIAQELSSQAPEGNEFWPPFLGYRLKITDSLLALFTLLLVIVGAWQGYQRRRTVQSRITGERPQIYPGPFNSSKLLPSGAHAEYPLADGVPLPIIDWTFMNVGKSPGIIREVRGELVLDRLPWRRRFTYSKVVPAELIVREGQQTDDISFPFNRNLTVDEINYLGVGTVQFCFFGYVKYTDTFHQLHTKAFAFRIYIRPRDRVQPIGGRRYNYIKTERTPRRYDT
jgi:hypothetical protein